MTTVLYRCPDENCGFEKLIDESRETGYVSEKYCRNPHYDSDLGWHSFGVTLVKVAEDHE